MFTYSHEMQILSWVYIDLNFYTRLLPDYILHRLTRLSIDASMSQFNSLFNIHSDLAADQII